MIKNDLLKQLTARLKAGERPDMIFPGGGRICGAAFVEVDGVLYYDSSYHEAQQALR